MKIAKVELLKGLGFSGFLILFLQVGCGAKITKEEIGEDSQTVFSPQCSDGEIDSFGVIGGKKVAKANPISQSVVFLMARISVPEKGDSIVKCTGTMISETVVLTAAHCVNFDGLKEQPSRLSVVFGVDPGCSLTAQDKTKVIEAQKIEIHTNWNERFPEKGSDMALIKLSKPTPEGFVHAKTFNSQIPVTLDNNIWGVGFGVTTQFGVQDSASPFLRAAHLVSPKKAFGKLLKLDQSHGQSLCSGDSGGPLILATEKGSRIAGVASFVEPLDLDGERCGGYVTYNLISNELKWLKPTFMALSPQEVSPF